MSRPRPNTVRIQAYYYYDPNLLLPLPRPTTLAIQTSYHYNQTHNYYIPALLLLRHKSTTITAQIYYYFPSNMQFKYGNEAIHTNFWSMNKMGTDNFSNFCTPDGRLLLNAIHKML